MSNPKPPTVADQIKRLQKYPPHTPCACAVWLPEDVRERAREISGRLGKNQVARVLENLHRNHDATIGINYDVIDAAITFVKRATKANRH